MKTHKFFNVFAVIALVVMPLSTPTTVSAQTPNPRIQVRLNQNVVMGTQWILGTTVTLNIDDPSTPNNIDYSASLLASPYWDPGYGGVWFELGSALRLKPGYLVSLSDGNIIIEHVVRDIRVTDFDYEADTVSGTGDPYGAIQVYVGGAQREIVANQNGQWMADFSQPGDQNWEQSLFDINPGMPMNEGEAIHFDDPENYDRDYTQITFQTYFSVNIGDGDDWIFGSNWFVGEPVTLTIDDPNTPDTPDYIETAMPQVGPWVLTGVEFHFDVHPGYIVTMSQDDIVKSIVVGNSLEITGVDAEMDKVYGRATPWSYVGVGATGGSSFRTVRADQNGNWTADFSIATLPWEEPVNITYETDVNAGEFDADADSYGVSWQWPWIEINLTDNLVQGLGWQLGASATLTIDDPTNGLGVDYSETQTVVSDNPWGGSETWVEFAPSIEINHGDIVTLTDSQTIKTHIVEDITITSIESATERVFGTTGSNVDMLVVVYGCASRRFSTDQEGNWVADFSIPGENEWEWATCDIQTGTGGMVAQMNSASDWEYKFWIVSQNVPPSIKQITALVEPRQINTTVNATATFIDPDANDTHTATWAWGDGQTSAGIVDESNQIVSGSHIYTTAGVYTVKITVTDAAGESDSFTSQQYVVIYDPNGGFVTGGGWIMSLAGAYTANPLLTGKATFGFISKYQKGANIPTGNTEFQFHVANMNFKSTSYDWMVIAGSRVQYKGTGKINGAGNYGFMLTAIDGSPDKFRIKIWDIVTEQVIYDNMLGAEEMDDSITAIEGGSIVIHKDK